MTSCLPHLLLRVDEYLPTSSCEVFIGVSLYYEEMKGISNGSRCSRGRRIPQSLIYGKTTLINDVFHFLHVSQDEGVPRPSHPLFCLLPPPHRKKDEK